MRRGSQTEAAAERAGARASQLLRCRRGHRQTLHRWYPLCFVPRMLRRSSPLAYCTRAHTGRVRKGSILLTQPLNGRLSVVGVAVRSLWPAGGFARGRCEFLQVQTSNESTFHSETPNRKRSRPQSGRGMSAVPSARRRSQRTRPRAQGEAARYPPTTARGRSRPRRRPRPRRPPTRSLGSGTVCMMSRRRPSRPQGVRRPGETPFLVHLASSLAVTMYP